MLRRSGDPEYCRHLHQVKLFFVREIQRFFSNFSNLLSLLGVDSVDQDFDMNLTAKSRPNI